MIREEIYFEDGLTCIEDVIDRYGRPLDATGLSKIAKCPRYHELRMEKNLRKPGASAPMAAGIAVHLGLDYYYAVPAPRGPVYQENAIEMMAGEWRKWDIDPALSDKPHLTEAHLRTVMENYFRTWEHERIDVFKPIAGLQMDDLNLNDVIAAKFKLTNDGSIILGESSLIMRFDLGEDTLILAGKPDLPAMKQDGRIYVMDHKTTSGYLSDWWAKSHEVSNKLRGYMAMVQSLLDRRCSGAVINGIYVGKYATNPDSKATKFQRFQFDFSTDHVSEALRNQLAWQQTIEFYRNELGYFPQGCGFGGCQAPDICRRDPATRAEVEHTDYEVDERSFWDL